MWDASPGIKAALEATGVVRVDLEAVLGFGLTRSAYPWQTAWPRLVSAGRPDLVVAMFGGWDGPQALSNGASWYAGLVERATELLTAGGAHLVWLQYPRNQPPDVPGQPPVDQTANEHQRESLDAVFALSARLHEGLIEYVPVDPILDQHRRFSAFADGARIRKHDNIHFCPAGAERVGAWVLDALTPAYGLPRASPAWRAGVWRTDRRYDQPSGACA
jgi:hypothetical protein